MSVPVVQSPGDAIIEKRRLFVPAGARDGEPVCEAWEIELPSALDENHGRLRRASADPGGLELRISFDRKADDLALAGLCVKEGAGELCLPCSLPNSETRAYAREDECVAGQSQRAAKVSGCAAALGADARDRARAAVDGSLRDGLIAAVAKARVVSLRRATSCADFYVRKQGKRLLLDGPLSSYPHELTAGKGGAMTFEEVPERNPRYRPPAGGEAIAIGCCGGDSYRVLDLSDRRALLQTAALGKTAPRNDELWFEACPAAK